MADPSQDIPERGGALKRQVDLLRAIQGALLDACVVVDRDKRVAGFNRPFFALFPRRVARSLEGARLGDLIDLRLNDAAFDPMEVCLERGAAVRFDEIEGVVVEGARFHLIVTASPIFEGESLVGGVVLLRDVSDEVKIQSKYQSMLHEEASARAKIEALLQERTGALLAANDALNALQAEVGLYARGLLLPDPAQIDPGRGAGGDLAAPSVNSMPARSTRAVGDAVGQRDPVGEMGAETPSARIDDAVGAMGVETSGQVIDGGGAVGGADEDVVDEIGAVGGAAGEGVEEVDVEAQWAWIEEEAPPAPPQDGGAKSTDAAGQTDADELG